MHVRSSLDVNYLDVDGGPYFRCLLPALVHHPSLEEFQLFVSRKIFFRWRWLSDRGTEVAEWVQRPNTVPKQALFGSFLVSVDSYDALSTCRGVSCRLPWVCLYRRCCSSRRRGERFRRSWRRKRQWLLAEDKQIDHEHSKTIKVTIALTA